MWWFSHCLLPHTFYQEEEYLKVVYPICCGVDILKTFLIGTIISTTDSVQPHYQKKRFSTYTSNLRRFADWLHLNNCPNVCMESTGKYWGPVFNILEERGIRVTIANPKWVMAVKGNKERGFVSLRACPRQLYPVKGCSQSSRIYPLQIIWFPRIPSIQNIAFLFYSAYWKRKRIPCLNPLKDIPLHRSKSFAWELFVPIWTSLNVSSTIWIRQSAQRSQNMKISFLCSVPFPD